MSSDIFNHSRFFEIVKRRRSVRKFSHQPVDESAIFRAIDSAILAPNSSNVQTWDFFWVRSAEQKAKLIAYCLNQSAARSAAELIVVSADPKNWRRSQAKLIKWVSDEKAPSEVLKYYQILIPMVYRWGVFNSLGLIKAIVRFFMGLFRPAWRFPSSRSELQFVAVKSAALAAENFVLSLTAEGLSTCMMEGFDEVRVKSLLGLSSSARVAMVIAVGHEGERALWGAQFRLPREDVFHVI